MKHDYDCEAELAKLRKELEILRQDQLHLSQVISQIVSASIEVNSRLMALENYLPSLRREYAGELGPAIPESVLGIVDDLTIAADGTIDVKVAPFGVGLHYGPFKGFDVQDEEGNTVATEYKFDPVNVPYEEHRSEFERG